MTIWIKFILHRRPVEQFTIRKTESFNQLFAFIHKIGYIFSRRNCVTASHDQIVLQDIPSSPSNTFLGHINLNSMSNLINMKSNIGKIDRLIRLAIAIFLLTYAYWQGSWIAFAFSIFTFYESWAGWCAFYQLIGRNSCPLSK
jgi:hypothetical protein